MPNGGLRAGRIVAEEIGTAPQARGDPEGTVADPWRTAGSVLASSVAKVWCAVRDVDELQVCQSVCEGAPSRRFVPFVLWRSSACEGAGDEPMGG